MKSLRAALLQGVVLLAMAEGGAAQDAPLHVRMTTLEEEKGYLLSASGQWRTENPLFEPGGQQPKEFGLDYHWGPHRKHIIGELVGVGERGGRAVYATIYITFNPVTEAVQVDLIGWDGAYGPAVERQVDDTTRLLESVMYGADGTVVAGRHAFELIDSNTYRARSYTKHESEGWVLDREEVWRQLPKENAPSR